MTPANRWLALIIAVHLALGLVYMWATPMFEASDEGVHYAVVHWLAQGNGLPVQRVPRPGEPKVITTYEQQGSQPPLYYALAAGITAWVDTGDFEQVYVRNPLSRLGVPGTTHNVTLYRHLRDQSPFEGTALAVSVIRLFSLGLSCVTIAFTFLIARRLFPDNDSLALLASALVAFNPMALFINASVNNDNLLMMLSTVGLWAILHLAQPNVSQYAWKSAGLGLILGLAALSKVSGLVLWPIAALAVAWDAWPARDVRRLVVSGVLMGGVALLASGWWFWRNMMLYGEPFGTRTMVAIAGPRVPPIGVWDLIVQEWEGFYLSYWGVFGVFSILPDLWVRIFFAALTVLALIGLGWAALRPSQSLAGRERFGQRMDLWLCVAFIVLTLLGLVNWTLQTFASQGRLMFGAIAPLSIFMALGLLTLAGRRARGAALGLASTLAVVALLIPVTQIAPHYSPPAALAESQLPSDLRPVQAVINDSMELIGYTSEMAPRRTQAGETQPVTLYWRVLKPMEKDYALALILLGRNSTEEVGKIDTWPGGGLRPTSQWTPGLIFADAYQLPIRADASAPSLLRLSVAAWDGQPSQLLPVVTPQGASTSVSLTVGRLVPAHGEAFTPSQTEGSAFEHGITLSGYDLGRDQGLTLYWHLAPGQGIPADYTVFIHVFDENGQKAAQADGVPLNGDWPTSAWVPGQAFADVRALNVQTLPSGRYAMHLGFYDASNGARLSAFRADGSPWADNAVILEKALDIP
jgi:hypothetical protein